MKTWSTLAAMAAVLGLGAMGCSSEPEAKVPGAGGAAHVVSAAAANKFNEGLAQLAAHDKANDWSDATCTATAQLFLDAAKEQGDKPFNEAVYDAGISYQRCKKSAEAKAQFKAILDRTPTFHRARMQLALYAFAESGEKNYDQAISEMRQAAITDAQFKNVEALVDLGMLYIKRNNKQPDNEGATDLLRAKKYIQSALAVDDGFMPAFNQLAILYLEAAKQGVGRSNATRVRTNAAKERKADTQALELAALVCSQAIRKNPKYAPIHNTAGMIQVELGNLNGAVGEFDTARKIDPTFYEAQMNYAAVNMQFRGFAQAEDAYRAALRMRPTDYDAHLGLALALRGEINDSNFDKNVPAASAELAAAKQASPDRAETYYNEAILTQEYKAKAGGPSAEAELNNAKNLFSTFITKAGSTPEYADAVKRSRERMTEIDQIIKFNHETKAQQDAAKADAKNQAAEAEVKTDEEPGAGTSEGEKKP
jgi:tetratricopeptide (TPR) repeat protein